VTVQQQLLTWEPERRTLTVSELSAAIRATLGSQFGDVWIAGEISGLKMATSGHAYFNLKDAGAQIKCACFRGALRLMKFQPQEGIAVLARGKVDVYEPRGEYQLIVETIEPQGLGALQLAFEQLKKKLAAEGLFDAARKRPLPPYPMRIGIVTSATGAVIRDMLNILQRRFPGLHIRLFPAQVQGAGSVDAVVAGLQYFSETHWAEVVIVGRGGGSLEDLWTFNDEAVARAIAASPVPVISAVGHETDFTIADFVADLRAPTPSAAAELVVRKKETLFDRISTAEQRLGRTLQYQLSRSALRLDEAEYRMRSGWSRSIAHARERCRLIDARLHKSDPKLRLLSLHRRLDEAEAKMARLAERRLTEHQTRLDRITQRLAPALTRRLETLRHRLARLQTGLDQLGPQRVLERGYAIVQNEQGQALVDPTQTTTGEQLHIRLARGRLKAIATPDPATSTQ
jgi:exodeoxyribonuclease VII large subunit